MGLLDMGLKIGLDQVRDNVINPRLEGIGKVEDITFKDKKLYARLRLVDLEQHPLEIVCEGIKLAPDGSTVIIGKFTANKSFMQVALDRYLAGKPINVPDGAPRLAVMGARKFLGLKD